MRRPACWGERPAVMGVVNLTPDSFSDGGRFNRLDLALKEASKQVSAGADVLDLGAQSTRPGAEEVGAILMNRNTNEAALSSITVTGGIRPYAPRHARHTL